MSGSIDEHMAYPLPGHGLCPERIAHDGRTGYLYATSMLTGAVGIGAIEGRVA